MTTVYRATEASPAVPTAGTLTIEIDAHGLPAWAGNSARILVPLFFFALPLSTALTNAAGAVLMLVAIACAKPLRPLLAQSDKLLLAAVLLLPLTAILGAGVALAHGHFPWRVIALHRKELVFIAILLTLRAAPALIKSARRSLWLGATVASALTFANWAANRSLVQGGPFNPVEPVSMTHAFHNFIVGTVCLWMVISASEQRHVRPRRQTVGLLTVGMLGLAAVFFLVTGRTGQVSIFVMLLVYIALRVPPRAALVGGTTAILVTTALLALPSTFSDRMQLAREEVLAYQQGKQVSSVGLRILFLSSSADLISKQPIIGYGTGSFRAVHDNHLGIAPMSEKSAPHPHNDLAHFWLERGLPGLLALLIVYGALWRAAAPLNTADRCLLRSVVAGFFTAGLANAFLLDWASGSFLFALSALLLTGSKSQPDSHG